MTYSSVFNIISKSTQYVNISMTPLQTNLLPGIDHTMAVHTHLPCRLGGGGGGGRSPGRLAKETAAKAHTTWNQTKGTSPEVEHTTQCGT